MASVPKAIACGRLCAGPPLRCQVLGQPCVDLLEGPRLHDVVDVVRPEAVLRQALRLGHGQRRGFVDHRRVAVGLERRVLRGFGQVVVIELLRQACPWVGLHVLGQVVGEGGEAVVAAAVLAVSVVRGLDALEQLAEPLRLCRCTEHAALEARVRLRRLRARGVGLPLVRDAPPHEGLRCAGWPHI